VRRATTSQVLSQWRSSVGLSCNAAAAREAGRVEDAAAAEHAITGYASAAVAAEPNPSPPSSKLLYWVGSVKVQFSSLPIARKRLVSTLEP
jgi:hypothetical protein